MVSLGTMRITKPVSMGAVVLTAVATIATPAIASRATPVHEAERRCGRAVLAARTHVQTADTRALAYCSLAVLSHANAEDTDEICRRLRTTLAGTDLVDRRARKRIAESCAVAWPTWLAASCTGRKRRPGPSVATPSDLAQCIVGATHCLARRAVESLVGPLEDSIGRENPDNLLFEYGDVDGNSFDACGGE